MAQQTDHHPNYKRIYIALLVLLAISVAGPFLGVFWITMITAFGIAFVKARLVVANFMHLKWERRIATWVLVAALAMMVLFFFGTAPDIMKHEGLGWENTAAKAAVERGVEDGASADAH